MTPSKTLIYLFAGFSFASALFPALSRAAGGIGSLNTISKTLYGVTSSAPQQEQSSVDELMDNLNDVGTEEGLNQAASLTESATSGLARAPGAAMTLLDMSGEAASASPTMAQLLGGKINSLAAGLADNGSTIVLGLGKEAPEAASSFVSAVGEALPEAINGMAEGTAVGAAQKIGQDAVFSMEDSAERQMYSQSGVLDFYNHSGDNGLDLSKGVSDFMGTGPNSNLTAQFQSVSTPTGFGLEGTPNAGFQSGMQMMNTVNPYYGGNPSIPSAYANNQNVSFPTFTASYDPKTGIQTNFNNDGTTTVFSPIAGAPGQAGFAPDGSPVSYPLESYVKKDANGNTVDSGYESLGMGVVDNCSPDSNNGAKQVCADQDGNPVEFSSGGTSPAMAAIATNTAPLGACQQSATDNEGLPSCESTADSVTANAGISPDSGPQTTAVDPNVTFTPTALVSAGDLPTIADPTAASAPGTSGTGAGSGASATNTTGNGSDSDDDDAPPAVAQVAAAPTAPGNADCSAITDPAAHQECQANLNKGSACAAAETLARNSGADMSKWSCSASDSTVANTQTALKTTGQLLNLQQTASGNNAVSDVAANGGSQDSAQKAADSASQSAAQAGTEKGTATLAAASVDYNEANKHAQAASDPNLVAAMSVANYQIVPGPAGTATIVPPNSMAAAALTSVGAPSGPMTLIQAQQYVTQATTFATKAQQQETAQANKDKKIFMTTAVDAVTSLVGASQTSASGKQDASSLGSLANQAQGLSGSDGATQGPSPASAPAGQ